MCLKWRNQNMQLTTVIQLWFVLNWNQQHYTIPSSELECEIRIYHYRYVSKFISARVLKGASTLSAHKKFVSFFIVCALEDREIRNISKICKIWNIIKLISKCKIYIYNIYLIYNKYIYIYTYIKGKHLFWNNQDI